MQPNDMKHVSVPARDNSQPAQRPDRDLAVALMRQQIDNLYDEPNSAQPEPKAEELEHTYDHTHDNTEVKDVNGDQWQRYHTAWQQYYQQYYERYYLSQAHAREQRRLAEGSLLKVSRQSRDTTPDTAEDGIVTKDKALHEIRSDLTSKIESHAKRVRSSRHFVPILSAVAVMILFLFLQYNRLVVAQVKAYISPGSINPQNVILADAADVKVGPEPRLIIPKINVDAPVVYGLTTLAEPEVQAALKNGVIHYPIPGASANPGEKGNAVFLGHSSNDVFDDGNYKFIFVQLEQMKEGDRFYINYNSVRYTYTVTSTETISPKDVSKLVTQNTRPTVTLVTCTPVGTAQSRFLVHAEQVSPNPDQAAVAAQPTSSESTSSISGNSPTLFDRLFGF